MRITSGIIASQYKKNLNQSAYDLSIYGNRATTYRKFDKVSEDPVGAVRTFTLRKEYYQNEDYQGNLETVNNMFSTAESSLMAVHKVVQDAATGDCIQAITGTAGTEERSAIAAKLRALQDNVLAQMNTQYANQYLFGGTNQSELPFTVDAAGNLLYRGVDVNTGKLANEDGAITSLGGNKISFGKDNGDQFNGYTVQVVHDSATLAEGTGYCDTASKTITVRLADGATAADLQTALNTQITVSDPAAMTADLSKITVSGDTAAVVADGTSAAITDRVDLKTLADEKQYVDLGIGLKFNADGSVNQQSAFNASLSGISFIGFGSEDGVSGNLYTLMGQIADQLDTGAFSMDNIQPYLDKFNQLDADLMKQITGMGVRCNYLDEAKTRLKDSQTNLTKKMKSVEYLDEAGAIMDFKQQETAYKAALQMGTMILQPSFLDYMR